MHLKKCRSCKAEKFSSIIDLGNQPWCGDLISKKNLGKEYSYPLHLIQCDKCELLQLNYTVKKEIMFSNHTYLSSTTDTLKTFFYRLAIENKNQFNLNDSDVILDIGGNDGTQMLQYKKAGIQNVINIESAKNISLISKKSGVRTINGFFNLPLVKKHFKRDSVKLINASGVFFHLEELHSVIEGIKFCLKKESGILVIQFMYVGSIVKKHTFDSIYHEHLCLYTLKSLSKLLKIHDLKIFDAYSVDIHSGSLVVKACHKSSKNFVRTKRYYKAHQHDLIFNKNRIQKFGKDSKLRALKIKKTLLTIKKNQPNLKIYAYGAPAKGNTLLNFLEIDTSLIQKCVEVNKLKIGKFLPQSHIPIVKETDKDIPDYYLLLSHNFLNEIIKKNFLNIERRGLKFIVPFPKMQIIDRNHKLFIKIKKNYNDYKI